MTTRLPVVLENIRIASPCNEDWDDMRGDERVRFCGRCEKNVYNLSALSRTEAEALVAAKEGRMCVRMYQRKDGTVLTSDCPVGVQRARLRHRIWASVCGAAASAALFLGLATGRARADLTVDGHKVAQPALQPPAHTRVMGGAVAMPQPQVKKMGKIAMPDPETVKAQKKKQPEPEREPPLMGDISPESIDK